MWHGQAVPVLIRKTFSWDTGISNDTISSLSGRLCTYHGRRDRMYAYGTVTITGPTQLRFPFLQLQRVVPAMAVMLPRQQQEAVEQDLYSYRWTDGQTTSHSNRLVLCRNCSCCHYGCERMQDSTDVTISNPVAPSVSFASMNNVSCHGGANGSAAVNVSGGNPPYTLWSPSGGNTFTASGLFSRFLSGNCNRCGGL